MTNKRRTVLVLSWGLVIACMIIIFSFSHQQAGVSSQTSGGVISKLFEMFHIELSQHFVRKSAHALEYFGLCFSFYIAFAATYLKNCPWLSLACTVLYAASDEIHQFFIPGRACQLRDVFVDACGAVVSVVICTAVYMIYRNIKSKSEEKTCQY